MAYKIIRNPDEKYWPTIYDLVIRADKWFNTLNDYDIWRKGFGDDFSLFIAIDEDSDKAIGCACAVDYRRLDGSPLVTVNGMVWVHPGHRARGVGLKLSEKVMSKETGFKNKCLIAVPAMAPKYTKLFGFNKIPEDNITDIEVQIKYIKMPESPKQIDGITFKTAEEDDWPGILKFDHEMLKYSTRDKFLKLFCTQPNSFFKIAKNDSGKVVAVCLIRCNEEMRMLCAGPFYASSNEVASELFTQTLQSVTDLDKFDTIRLAFYKHSPTLDIEALSSVPEARMQKSYHFIQFTDQIIELPTEKIYGITENDVTYI